MTAENPGIRGAFISDNRYQVAATAPDPRWPEYLATAGEAVVSRDLEGVWRVVKVTVFPAFRQRGLLFDLLRNAVEKLGPIRTSRVFSPDGKRQLQGLVRRGWAEDLGGDDFLLHFGHSGAVAIPLMSKSQTVAERIAARNVTRDADALGRKVGSSLFRRQLDRRAEVTVTSRDSAVDAVFLTNNALEDPSNVYIRRNDTLRILKARTWAALIRDLEGATAAPEPEL